MAGGIAKRGAGHIGFNILRASILAFHLVFVLAPIYWMLVTSLKTDKEIVNVNNITYWPMKVTFNNYLRLFDTLQFGVYLRNSVYFAVVSSVFVVIISIFGGYSLARFKFTGKMQFILFLLITQMVPGVLVMIPMYIVYLKFSMTNTYTGLFIIYIIGQLPFCVITMRSFFQRIPVSLEESARVEGCSRAQAIFKIIVPILLPGIISVFVFSFTAVWNDLMTGIIFTSKTAYRTIPVGMKGLIGKLNVQWGELTAGGIVALLPTVVMFAFVQRFVVSGLTAGSVKE
jgi:multiple sugar transport system permease protein